MSARSVKWPYAVLLLLAALLFVSEGAEAIDPEWSYETGGDVRSVAVSADGEYYVVGSDDSKVYLFDKDSSTPLWSYEAVDTVRSVSISADGGYIAVGTNAPGDYWDGIVYIFGNGNSTPLWSYNITTGENAVSVSISADGAYISVGSSDNKVYALNPNGTLKWEFETQGKVRS